MASAYLTRTPSSSGNLRTFTFSAWFKKSATNAGYLFGAGDMSDGDPSVAIEAGENIQFRIYSGGHISRLVPTQVARDNSAWYHYVVAVDTTQATASNRVKVYINGSQVTDFSTEEYMTQNYDTVVNSSSYVQRVGDRGGGNFNGCMAHVHLIDGTQYQASDFGESDSVSGIWKPKTSPSVTYGTNGFFLKMENSSDMGEDSSGNNNDFTTSGTITQTEDTPSNNFATLNPLLDVNAVGTYSNGNLGFTGTGSTNFGGCSMPVSKGKWYVEVKTTVSGSYYPMLGVIDAQSTLRRNSVYFTNTDVDTNNPSGFGVQANGDIYHNADNTYGNLGTTYTTGDIIGLALDMDSATKTLGFYKNGTLQTTINLDDPPSGSYIFCASIYATYSSAKTDWNFGNGYFGTTAVASSNSDSAGLGLFEYSVPSGYYALCTKNIKNYG